jgi:hypothetical protein
MWLFVCWKKHAHIHKFECDWVVEVGHHKGSRTIKVQLAQGNVKLTHEMVLNTKLKCGGTKFEKNFIMCELDNIKSIIGSTFLDSYHVDILRRCFKFEIIVMLANKLVSLNIE